MYRATNNMAPSRTCRFLMEYRRVIKYDPSNRGPSISRSRFGRINHRRESGRARLVGADLADADERRYAKTASATCDYYASNASPPRVFRRSDCAAYRNSCVEWTRRRLRRCVNLVTGRVTFSHGICVSLESDFSRRAGRRKNRET